MSPYIPETPFVWNQATNRIETVNAPQAPYPHIVQLQGFKPRRRFFFRFGRLN